MCAAFALRVKWNADASCLASASDDRTVRLWQLPPNAHISPGQHTHAPALPQQAQHAQQPQQIQPGISTECLQQGEHAQQAQHTEHGQQTLQARHEPAECLQPVHVLYGHSARLWDCHFGDTVLVTASEDCTARWVCSLLKLNTLDHSPTCAL